MDLEKVNSKVKNTVNTRKRNIERKRSVAKSPLIDVLTTKLLAHKNKITKTWLDKNPDLDSVYLTEKITTIQNKYEAGINKLLEDFLDKERECEQLFESLEWYLDYAQRLPDWKFLVPVDLSYFDDEESINNYTTKIRNTNENLYYRMDVIHPLWKKEAIEYEEAIQLAIRENEEQAVKLWKDINDKETTGKFVIGKMSFDEPITKYEFNTKETIKNHQINLLNLKSKIRDINIKTRLQFAKEDTNDAEGATGLDAIWNALEKKITNLSITSGKEKLKIIWIKKQNDALIENYNLELSNLNKADYINSMQEYKLKTLKGYTAMDSEKDAGDEAEAHISILKEAGLRLNKRDEELTKLKGYRDKIDKLYYSTLVPRVSEDVGQLDTLIQENNTLEANAREKNLTINYPAPAPAPAPVAEAAKAGAGIATFATGGFGASVSQSNTKGN